MTLLDKLPQNKEVFNQLGRYERSELHELTTKRLNEMPKEERTLEQQETHQLKALLNEAEQIEIFRSLYQEDIQEREALIEEAKQGGVTIESYQVNERKQVKEPMENNKEIEVRSLQKYLVSGYKNMNDEEQRALNVSGSAVVIPTEVMNRLITDEKYSTLLNRATVFNEPRAGKISIPIASNTSASFKIENSAVDGSEASYEASPTLTNLELSAYELMRLAQISSAAHSLSTAEFENTLLQLLGSEVIETLEGSFIQGTGVGEPLGLDNMSWTPDVNAIEATTAIAPADIAAAISLLKAKYARNAVVMMNTSTYADVALFKGTNEFAYDLSAGAEKFLGHQIIINEWVKDDEIFILDPKELYVRFSMPLQLEADKSAGFTSASIHLRALCIVDAKFNPKAVAKVSIAA